jgi:hypothetical protein
MPAPGTTVTTSAKNPDEVNKIRFFHFTCAPKIGFMYPVKASSLFYLSGTGFAGTAAPTVVSAPCRQQALPVNFNGLPGYSMADS